MADIRVRVPDAFMEKLRATLDVPSNTDVIQEALTLLAWAAEERTRGRLILSTDMKGGEVERLAMRSLSAIQPRAQPASVAQA